MFDTIIILKGVIYGKYIRKINEYYFKDGINTGLIKSQTFGDKGDKYSFDYNNYGKVIKIIYYQGNSNQGIDLCTYDYDNIGRPVKYHHLVDDEYIIEILYNDNNDVGKIISSKGFSIEYKYDNLGKINYKNISFNNKNIYQFLIFQKNILLHLFK